MGSLPLTRDVSVTHNRIDVKVDERFRENYLWDDFFVEYSEDLGLSDMDPAIVIAPFVLNVVQLVWLSDRTFRLDSLDAELVESLGDIRAHIKKRYPGRSWDGQLVPDRSQRSNNAADGPPARFFTGGVDSVYPSLRRYPECSRLFAIWGNEHPLDFGEKWQLFRQNCEAFAAQHGHDIVFARTNAKEIIKRKSLRPEIPVWWRNLQQGMGLVGLGIPALVHWGSPSILLASSHTQDFKEAWGSEPEIEGRVRCAGLSAIHDGYEATRQTKPRSPTSSMSVDAKGYPVRSLPCVVGPM